MAEGARTSNRSGADVSFRKKVQVRSKNLKISYGGIDAAIVIMLFFLSVMR